MDSENSFNLNAALQRPEVRRSLALRRAMVNKILGYPDVVDFLRLVLQNCQRIAPQHPNDPWLAEWCVLLSNATGPESTPYAIQKVFDTILEETEHGINMRQSIYFGVPILSHTERIVALNSVKKVENVVF